MLKSKKDREFQMHINDLPYDILLKIFSFLSVEDRLLDACLVCKMWYDICFDGTFWQDIDFEDRRKMTNEILLRSVRYSDYITSLSLHDCYSDKLSYEGVIEATRSCPNLTSLNLKNSLCRNVEDNTVIEVCKNCPKLEVLNLHSQAITDDAAINGIAKYLTQLKSLNIQQNVKVTNKGVIAILNNCPDLENLRVGLLRQVTDDFMRELAEREKKKPRMKELCLSMTFVTGNGTQYLQYLKNLEYVDITKCANLDYDDVFVLVTNATKIKHFFCGMQDKYDDRCVEITAIHLPHLIEIYFGSTSISDKGMEYLATYSKNLEWLNVSYSLVTEKGIEAVCANLPKLRHLGLTRCDKANEEAVEVVVQRYPKVYFSTFLQETRRMLIQHGQWFDVEPEGPVTQKMILDRISVTKPSVRTKPKRLIGTGGKVEYIPFELPYMSSSTDSQESSLSTEKQELSTDKQESSTDKQELSTDKQESSTDKQESSTDKQELSTDKQDS